MSMWQETATRALLDRKNLGDDMMAVIVGNRIGADLELVVVVARGQVQGLAANTAKVADVVGTRLQLAAARR